MISINGIEVIAGEPEETRVHYVYVCDFSHGEKRGSKGRKRDPAKEIEEIECR